MFAALNTSTSGQTTMSVIAVGYRVLPCPARQACSEQLLLGITNHVSRLPLARLYKLCQGCLIQCGYETTIRQSQDNTKTNFSTNQELKSSQKGGNNSGKFITFQANSTNLVSQQGRLVWAGGMVSHVHGSALPISLLCVLAVVWVCDLMWLCHACNTRSCC